jgi:hypothetical protein
MLRSLVPTIVLLALLAACASPYDGGAQTVAPPRARVAGGGLIGVDEPIGLVAGAVAAQSREGYAPLR